MGGHDNDLVGLGSVVFMTARMLRGAPSVGALDCSFAVRDRTFHSMEGDFMSLPRLAPWLLLAASLLACSDSARVVAPTRLTAAAAALADKESTGNDESPQSVVGEAVFEPTDQGVSDVHYSLEGKRHKNGVVDGEFKMSLIRDGQRESYKGEVFCFGLVGNTAHVSVKVVRSGNPNVLPGQYLMFTVVDDDQSGPERGNHSPDLTSFFFRTDAAAIAEVNCDFGNSLRMYPVRGKFELHPEPAAAN